jgi:hypothetical protein
MLTQYYLNVNNPLQRAGISRVYILFIGDRIFTISRHAWELKNEPEKHKI